MNTNDLTGGLRSVSAGRISFTLVTLFMLGFAAFVCAKASSPIGFMTLVGVFVAVLAFLVSCGFDWARVGMAVVAGLIAGVFALIFLGDASQFGIANQGPFFLVMLLVPVGGHVASCCLLLSPWVRLAG